MSDAKAEAELRKLQRLPENCVCADCGEERSPFACTLPRSLSPKPLAHAPACDHPHTAAARAERESKFGFGAVVVPYKSFVCDTCKSEHQSFSHRCKVRATAPSPRALARLACQGLRRS